MKKTLSAVALLVLANPVFAGDSWDKYAAVAQQVTQQIEQGSFTEIAKQGELLTKLSTALLPKFVAKQPICKEYIEAAMLAANKMLTLSLEDIEKDYHADGKLPPMKQAVCYHAKDLLVHPATVVVIAKTQPDNKDTRKMLHAEIEEVLEHFGEVKRNAGM